MTTLFPCLSTLSSEQRERFDLFARMLIEGNRVLNLTAIDDPEAIRIRHFEDSLAALGVLDGWAAEKAREGGGEPLRLIDVGSGAGFPGLAVALARPDWCVTSVESTGKKIAFQGRVVEALSLENVRLVQGRAEDLAHDAVHREAYDVVLARALAPLNVLLELTLPFARVGGRVVAWKGARVETEMEGVERALAVLGGGALESVPYALPTRGEEDGDAGSLRLILIPKIGSTPAPYPRKPKAIRKSPLGSPQGISPS